MFACFECESEKVKVFRVTKSESTLNKHVECLDCGDVWTEAEFLSPVVKKDDSNEGGA